MTLIQASAWQDKPEEWLIDGLLGPSLTIVSGEPKMGKSLLAGYLVHSLVTQQPILNREPRAGEYKVAWLGYDSNWANELLGRFPDIQESLYLQNVSITYDNEDAWGQLYKELVSLEVNLVVIDHLYGVSAELDLDESHFMQMAIKPIKHITDVIGIPVLLLAHAGKTGSGRALHSVILEAQARHLIRISGNVKSQNRDLALIGNQKCPTNLKISLHPDGITLKSETDATAAAKKSSERNGEMVNVAKLIVQESPDWARANASAAGRWLAFRGVSGTDNAGRTYVNKLIRGELLGRSPSDSTSIIPGPKLGM